MVETILTWLSIMGGIAILIGGIAILGAFAFGFVVSILGAFRDSPVPTLAFFLFWAVFIGAPVGAAHLGWISAKDGSRNEPCYTTEVGRSGIYREPC